MQRREGGRQSKTCNRVVGGKKQITLLSQMTRLRVTLHCTHSLPMNATAPPMYTSVLSISTRSRPLVLQRNTRRRAVVRGKSPHLSVHHTSVKPLVWWISCQGKGGVGRGRREGEGGKGRGEREGEGGNGRGEREGEGGKGRVGRGGREGERGEEGGEGRGEREGERGTDTTTLYCIDRDCVQGPSPPTPPFSLPSCPHSQEP